MTLAPLPDSLFSASDAVIDAFLNGRETEDALKQIKEWLELDGFENLLVDYDWVISIDNVASYWDDKEFALGWLEDGVKITDQMRIEHARKMLISRFEDDHYDVVSCHSYKLENRHGQSVFICCTMMLIPGGPEVTWQGLFSSEEEFRSNLKKSNCLTSYEINSLTDEQVLAFWQRKTPNLYLVK